MECSWLGRPPSGRPAGHHTWGRKHRFPVSSTTITCLLLQITDCTWKSYIFSSTADLEKLPSSLSHWLINYTLHFVSFPQPVALEGFLLLHLNIPPRVCWRCGWVNGGPGVWDLAKVKVKKEIFPVIVPSFCVRDGLMSSITPAGGDFW